MFFNTLLNGIKWGGIVFLLGVIVSFFSAISSIWERANKKSKLEREISLRDSMKDKSIDNVKNEFKRHVDEINDQIKRKEKSLEKDLADLDKERKSKTDALKNAQQEKIHRYVH